MTIHVHKYLGLWLDRMIFRAGFELIRLTDSPSALGNTYRLLCASSPDIVIDVGANIGQFAQDVLRLTPKSRVVSFEPLTTARVGLERRAASQPRWTVAPRMALGLAEASLNLNIAGNFVSSSLLPMLDTHLQSVPNSAYVGSEAVPVKRLDAVIDEYCLPHERLYLKIDTQGYEREVIAGAAGIMNRIVAMEFEVSFIELYANQTLAFELIRSVQQLGFKLVGISNEFQDPRSGELLQANVYFLRTP